MWRRCLVCGTAFDDARHARCWSCGAEALQAVAAAEPPSEREGRADINSAGCIWGALGVIAGYGLIGIVGKVDVASTAFSIGFLLAALVVAPAVGIGIALKTRGRPPAVKFGSRPAGAGAGAFAGVGLLVMLIPLLAAVGGLWILVVEICSVFKSVPH